MLANNDPQSRSGRRGIVLVLVLAMLGLLALIGVTFATFAGQSRINSRNFYQSLIIPQDDELMDFALGQLINDTGDPRSVIHGHSLARDMYGNDAYFNGYLPYSPTTGAPFYATAISPPTTNGVYIYYTLTTSIASNDYNFYGYNFNRWIMRVAGTAANGVSGGTVNQTFEIVGDSQFNSSSNAGRQFTIVIGPNDGQLIYTLSGTNQYIPTSSANSPTNGTALYNPTTSTTAGLPGQYMAFQGNSTTTGTSPINIQFQLDGRWLHAFGGPGMGAYAGFANFRFNNYLGLGGPNSVGMDEDYDACDLENWFLAIQSADGNVIIPSFHRPANIRFDPNGTVNDWTRTNADNSDGTSNWASSASRILRPVWHDGHDQNTFPDLTPDPNTGKVNYDVDNDGDGVTDSVWLDLGYPARRDSRGQLYKPLFAFMVIGLNGRIPLNTAGNLASGQSQAEHLGNSTSEIDPTYALQNAYAGSNPVTNITGASTIDYDPFDQLGNGLAYNAYAGGSNNFWGPNATPFPTNDGQVDNTVQYSTATATLGMALVQGLDVRTTQLRNILAGTRPQANPFAPDTTGMVNGDTNFVWGNWTGTNGVSYYMPNGIADVSDNNPIYQPTSGSNPIYVQRITTPVAGRWGEAASVPGYPFTNPNGPPQFNWVQTAYTNPVRAGYSFDVSDFITSAANSNNGTTLFPRDAADDNYNAFDPYPPRPGTVNPPTNTNNVAMGEVGDADYFDAAGANLLAVERIRRWVTPADINGTGRVVQWNLSGSNRGQFLGADNFGRVMFSSYFRPAGNPGVINTQYTYASGTQTPLATGYNFGAILYPPVPTDAGATDTQNFYAAGPNPINPTGSAANPATMTAATFSPAATAYPNYLPDVTNNPFHGFEAYKIPNLFQNPGGTTGTTSYNPQTYGGMPMDEGTLVAPTGMPPTGGNPGLAIFPTAGYTASLPTVPATFATYDSKANQSDRSDGLNEADEMNLYHPNPLLDSPYGPGDIEWLYRQDDIDGSTLSSRLSSLAPISFTNTIDGQRRRRLFSLDSWESNNFVWANDNPGGGFQYNARFSSTQSASFTTLGAPTPVLAQRDKKLNLNYPLPVSNDPNEPIRQKWIHDAYYLLKSILPPDSVDTAEELAQLSQYVINIVDFRDPDATMTHWVNPDVVLSPGTIYVPAAGAASAIQPMPPSLTLNFGSGSLDQYGMEYNPVAINEALAYSFTTLTGTTSPGTPIQTNRFFIELINTLPAAYNPGFDYNSPPLAANTINNYYGNASAITLGGFNYTQGDPYSGGCWDLVFTFDDPMSRPDPYRGELVGANTSNAAFASKINYFGLIPLNRDTFYAAATPSGNPALPNSGDVTLQPVNPSATSPNYPLGSTSTPTGSNYFYVIGDPPNTSSLSGGSSGTTSTTEANPPVSGNTITTAAGITGNSMVAQTMLANYDPFNSTGPAPTFTWYPGILPGSTTSGPPSNYSAKLPSTLNFPVSSTTGTRGAMNVWVSLRRPANPFAPVSAANPMCVVDSMRFPFIEGTGSTVQNPFTVGTNTVAYTYGTYNTIYSAQRLQPYRGGHAVAAPNAQPFSGSVQLTSAVQGATGSPVLTTTTVTTGATVAQQPPDPRYGYTEQLAVPATPTSTTAAGTNYGIFFNSTSAGIYPATGPIYHTLGAPNDSAENWDYLVFNDRDFTSVAELTLVPGSAPGLFTKQFCEVAPSQFTAANIFATVTPIITPTFQSAGAGSNTTPPTTGQAAKTTPAPTTQGIGTSSITITSGIPYVFTTASAPFLTISQNTPTPTTPLTTSSSTPPELAVAPFSTTFTTSTTSLIQPATGIASPVQPHSFPYLVDKFFYTGASSFYYPPTGGSTDPSTPSTAGGTSYPVVGGPAADGWFKMFDFFEVPSQMIGSIGPVAAGFNFDWARQDFKPGLININLIVDEEVFFSVFGRQDGSLNQTLLNAIELPYLLVPPPTSTAGSTPVLPYSLPLSGNINTATKLVVPPIPSGGPPVPLVVTAITATGAPSYVYPITDQTQGITHGVLLSNDPIQTALNNANGVTNPPVGNRIKAAFAQFLWLRHGGSGYIFGYGSGAVGQNSSIPVPALSNYTSTLPAERYFHSLSYPDINYTIMRPAALPPSTISMPAMVTDASSTNPAVVTVNNAQAILYSTTTAPTNSNWYFANNSAISATNTGYFYAPYCPGNSNFASGVPIVYTGDPGVRNPLLSQGYSSSGGTSPYTVQTTGFGTVGTATYSVPLGYPLPVNVAFPSGQAPAGMTPPVPLMDSVVMPPPIPPRRLFQPPDGYGSGTSLGTVNTALALINSGYTGTTTLAPTTSNASDYGDPWINNQIPTGVSVAQSPTVPVYSLNNGYANLDWSGGTLYNLSTVTTANAPLPPTGVLPLISTQYYPYAQTSISSNLTANLSFVSNSSTAPNSATRIYLGGTTGTSTTNTDDRQHPYFRSEQLQKAMNLTTVRTHQYAVWITVGFFEIIKQGDIGMLLQANPTAAYDIIGTEVGAVTGNNVRYRGFFLVDRTKLTGFNPNNIGSFRQAVVYRKVIQ